MTYAEQAFQTTIEGIRMARANAWTHRRAGNEAAARAAFERAFWYFGVARMWRARL